MSESIDIQSIASEVEYDPLTGIFTSRRSRGCIKAGGRIGTVRDNGYIEIQIGGKRIFAHRLAFALTHGYLPEAVDHINRIKDDNRACNLRAATAQQNNLNTDKPRANRFRGISLKSGKWQAAIRIDGKLTYIGAFDTDVRAAYEYDMQSLAHHKEFGRRNFLPFVQS